MNGCLFDDLPDMLRAEEVAAIPRVSRSAAYSIMHSDGFPSVLIGQKSVRVPKKRLMDWIDQRADAKSQGGRLYGKEVA